MVYADEPYYYNTYMGAVPETEFARLAVRASSYLDYITQNRAKDNTDLDALKMCCCALIDKYQVIEMAQKAAEIGIEKAAAADGEAKSEAVGSWSRTLATGGESAAAALSAADGTRKLLASVCNEYLAHTGLLYRGGGHRCTLPTL